MPILKRGTGATGSAGFSLSDIAGAWKSLEGAPKVRIYRDNTRKNGGFHIEFTYSAGDVFLRPLKQYFGIRYFNHFGFVAISYDAGQDVLRLDGYGNYYRE